MSDFDKNERLKGDKKIPLSILLKRLWHYIKPEIWWFVFAFLLIIVNVSIEAVMPQFIGMIVDELDVGTGVPSLSYIIWVALGYFILSVTSYIFYYFQGIALQKSGQRIIYNLRMEVFEHIESMSQNQFNEMPVGSLVTRVTNYTSSMSDLFTNVLVNLVKNILMVVVVFIMMLLVSWYLALIQLGFLLVVFLISYLFRMIVYRVFKKERQYLSEMNTFVNENLSGMKITQIFNQQKRKEQEFLVKNENLRKTRYQVVLAFGLYRPTLTVLYYAAIITTFIVGMNSAMTAAVAVEFYLYVSRFFNPVQNIADQLNAIQKANTASERLFNLLDIQPEVLDESDSIDVEDFKGKIEFRNVWFAYEKENWILKDVSFVIEPRQTVAFVGATGAGKTTILGLIVRNFEIQKGQILIDGI
ncbi:MAG TPA: ABC transporter transmembrane domain-containing protein, partial [Bacilli bacterium]|nr:ABC transporter transmembrane domain-containing protein [Bacilli bacterium]